MALDSTNRRPEVDEPGWFGKLSSLGDFAHRRLPDAWVRTCDAWLSEAMRGAAGRLGDRWLDTYLTAPILRFAWAPRVIDMGWWFGVLMPSCDRVGRYFPLVIAVPRARPPADRIALDHLELWFEHMAHSAVQTLHDGASLQHFEDTLREAPPWPTPSARAPTVTRRAGSQHSYQVEGTASLAQWLSVLAADELQAKFAGCSVWWRRARPQAPDHIVVLSGLPDAAAFTDLLAGGP